MSTQFFSKLSQNYVELLEDDEYYDITVEVGEDPNVKIFRAHMNILCYRSPYLRRILTSNKKTNDNALTHIKLPNISPENFQVILRYIYGGVLSLDDCDSSDIIKVLIAADKLCFQEIVDYLQRYLIEEKSDWMEQNFEFIQQASSQSSNLLKLQQFCTDFIAKSPEKIIKSPYFASLSEKSLISIIERDNLQMEEIEVWDHVLKWGLAQNPTLIPDPDTWSDDDFKSMANTLQHCLPLIRFFTLPSKEFFNKIRPYKKILKRQLYEDLLRSYLDPDSKPSENILLPRNTKIDENIDSKIVNVNIVSTISRWIDKLDSSNVSDELYLPYEFKLLLRGSRDGFTPKKFHELCDDKPKTVSFIKVKGTKEIIGGYNPEIWKTPSKGDSGQTKDSFIFSFKKENDSFKDAILSRVKNSFCALLYHCRAGPSFAPDIVIYAVDESIAYDTFYCKKTNYEKKIRDTEDECFVEDYEVFQIIEK